MVGLAVTLQPRNAGMRPPSDAPCVRRVAHTRTFTAALDAVAVCGRRGALRVGESRGVGAGRDSKKASALSSAHARRVFFSAPGVRFGQRERSWEAGSRVAIHTRGAY